MNIQITLVWIAVLLPLVFPACPNDCSPIISNGLFENEASWVISPPNTTDIFYDEQPINFIGPQYTRGYRFAFLKGASNYNFSQPVHIPPVPPTKELFLEFGLFVDVASSIDQQSNIVAFSYLRVIIDDTLLAELNPQNFNAEVTVMSYNVTRFGEGDHVIKFSIISTNPIYYTTFILDTVALVPKSIMKEGEVYVSSTIGNDLAGTGTIDSPYCSLRSALSSVSAGAIIHVADGLYCSGGDNALRITQSVTVQGYNSSEDSTGPKIDLLGRWTAAVVSRVDKVKFESLTFFNASYGSCISLRNAHNISIHNCSFLYGHADVVGVEGVSSIGIEIIDSKFSDIVGTAFTASQSDYITISRTMMHQNTKYILIDGGTTEVDDVELLAPPPVSVIEARLGNCLEISHGKVIIRHSSLIGCTIAASSSEVKLESTTMSGVHKFFQNMVHARSSKLSLLNSNISNSVVSFITLDDSESLLQVVGSYFVGLNTPDILFAIAKGNAIFDHCIFANLSAYTLIGVFRESDVKIQNSVFENNGYVDGIYAIEARIDIHDNHFKNNSGQCRFIKSEISIEGCTWEMNTRFLGAIFSSYSQVNIDHSTFQNNSGAISAMDDSTLNIKNSSFINNQESTIIVSSSQLRINESYFDGNRSPIIQFTSSTAIYGSTFRRNSGGVVMASGGSLTMINSTLYENVAQTGAVAILLLQGIDSDVNVTLQSNNISHNQALGAGGVFFSRSNEVVIHDSSSIYVDNIAPYGNFVATYPLALALQNNPKSEIVSGVSTIGNLVVELKDLYNQTVKMENIFVYLKIDDRNLASASFVDGIATFPEDALLFGKINSHTQYTLYTNFPGVASQEFPVYIAPCIAGFYPSDNGEECITCPESTYGYTGQDCLQCPDYAVCPGGTSVISLPGYWFDSSHLPYILYECGKSNCVGNNTCDKHREGLVCARCESGYYDWGNGCQRCARTSPLIITVGVIGAITAVLWFQRAAGSVSGFLSIVLYFVQTLMLIAHNVDFGFLSLVSLQLGKSKGASRVENGESSSTKHSISSYNICVGPYDFYDKYYFTYVAPLILCAFLGVAIVIEWSSRRILGIKKKEKVQLSPQNSTASFDINAIPSPEVRAKTSRYYGAFVNLILSVYGPVTENVFGILFCVQISHTRVLEANNAVECGGDQYRTAHGVGIFMLIVVILVPIILLVNLFFRSYNLESNHNKRIWGALYMQFKEPYYYWSVVVLFRRFLIVIFSMLTNQDARTFLLMLSMLVPMLLQLHFRPFVTDDDNLLESISLVLLFIYACFLDNGNANALQYVVLVVGLIFGICTLYVVGKMLKKRIAKLKLKK